MRDTYYDANNNELHVGDRVTSKAGLFLQGFVSEDWLDNVPEGSIRVYVNLLPVVTKQNTVRQRRKFYVVNPKMLVRV